MNFFSKVLTVLKDRPTYFTQYFRGFILFYYARNLGVFLLDKSRVLLGKNVRFQSIKNFMAASSESRITIGDHSIIYENARLESYGQGKIEIGESSILGDIRIVSRNKISLGRRTLSSWNVLIQDFDPHPTSQNLRAMQVQQMVHDFSPKFHQSLASPQVITHKIDWTPKSAEIIIGDDVWLGANSIILKGTKIGAGSIVAAGAVITGGSFPERSLIAGNPAIWIKELSQ